MALAQNVVLLLHTVRHSCLQTAASVQCCGSTDSSCVDVCVLSSTLRTEALSLQLTNMTIVCGAPNSERV